jgi:hypothetical protein
MTATALASTELMQPQERNRSGKIFGGFLMRQAYELAYSVNQSQAFKAHGLYVSALNLKHCNTRRRVASALPLLLIQTLISKRCTTRRRVASVLPPPLIPPREETALQPLSLSMTSASTGYRPLMIPYSPHPPQPPPPSFKPPKKN